MATAPTLPQALSADEVKGILQQARQHSTRDWAMFLLTFRHALRSQEVRRLKLADVDLDVMTINVSRVKGSRSGIQSLDRHRGESLLDEVLALRALAQRTRRGWLADTFPLAERRDAHADATPTAFQEVRPGRWRCAALAHPHVLRHALCSMMAAQHADVYAIQQRAGHKNISNTMVYTHVSDRQASEFCQEALMGAFAAR